MTQCPVAEIFCDGNEKVGWGHIRRSSALAARLEKEGIGVRVSGLSESASRMLPTPKYLGVPAKVVVFDSHVGIDDQIRTAHEGGQTTVALDWFGETIPNINIAVYPHGEVRATRQAYVGFQYILVREEIATLHRTPPTGRAKRVLVVIGGGDLLGQGPEAARRLRDEGLDVTLVQGPLAKAIVADVGYRVLVNPPELPQLLASCDWAVTNGGGCLFEALCVGKAAFVLPQTSEEWKIARFAEEHGAVLGVGIEGLRSFHPEEVRGVSEYGLELVDGRGVERVSSIIRGLL